MKKTLLKIKSLIKKKSVLAINLNNNHYLIMVIINMNPKRFVSRIVHRCNRLNCKYDYKLTEDIDGIMNKFKKNKNEYDMLLKNLKKEIVKLV